VLQEDKGWFVSRFAGLSTALKMFFILSFVLLPLGLVAILASIESARDNRAERTEQTLSRLEIKAQRLNALLLRTEDTIRVASAAVALTEPASGICERTLQRFAGAQNTPGRYAFFAGDGSLRCASPGYAPAAIANPRDQRSAVEIGRGGETLRLALFDAPGVLVGTAEFARQDLADLTFIPGTTGNFDLELVQGNRKMVLRRGYEGGTLVQTVQGSERVADGQLQLNITLSAVPISLLELIMILLPVAMWIGAAMAGWLVINRLVLRPLVQMQRAVAAYQPGDRGFDLPSLATPAREIRELGLAFDKVTRTVARHEADLESALERQTKLVREVHHRVKNNLQVVASLLNLHARGAKSEDVAAAYASIQRRVDALAVVHRNHYAELEESRGVALKPLISELGANLRATAPASAAHMQIRLDVEPFYATQDVAVSIAFLITELVELAMFCGGHTVTISLHGQDGRPARLSVDSPSLKAEAECDEQLFSRFDRIVTGLGRQLRSAIDRDLEAGCYALDIAVVGKADQ
jgi:signal transduction histidine kinase